MHDENIKFAEAQRRLREELLSFKERKRALIGKRIKDWGQIVCIILVLLCCGGAIYYGACGFDRSVKEATAAEQAYAINLPKAYCQKAFVNACACAKKSNEKTDAKTGAAPAIPLRHQCEYPRPWIPISGLIIKGIMVLCGVGVAGYTIRTIAKPDNE